jgi:hypothetical protein
LNINQKLSLNNSLYAISNKNDYGPTFGKVYTPADIFISARANINTNGPLDSRCNVGSMYKNTLFQVPSQDNQVRFCGAVTFGVK